MATRQIEKRFPALALAYLRYLAGERQTSWTSTPKPIYDGITREDIPAVRRRVHELIERAGLDRALVHHG